MKKFISAIFTVAIVLTAAAVNIDGSWVLNAWKGFRPAPNFIKGKDGSISVTNVTAKYGVGLINRTRVPASAGDTMKFTATVRGKGKLFFQLQNYDARNKWTGIGQKSVKTDLTSDWREVTLSLPVENCKRGATAFSVATTGVDKGGELFMKNTRLEVEETEYAGDFMFPRHWKVFAPVAGNVAFPLDKIPDSIGKVRGKTVSLSDNRLELTSFFPKQKFRNTALLYAELESAHDGKYTIGVGADYFCAVYVNGKCIIDTLQTGNQTEPPHFSNHKATALIQKGKNIIAVKFQAGGSKRPSISMGGAIELRNLSSILTVSQTFDRDSYEQPGKRIGDPKLIKGILTDGIEHITGQGVYRRNSTISFGKKYQLPSKVGGKLFAVGLRLYRVKGAGNLTFAIGENMTLAVSKANDKSDFKLTVRNADKVLKSTTLPATALPSDIVFAVSAHEYFVNAMSLQDSKLRSLHGKADFADKAPFAAEIKVNAAQAVIDEFFTGLVQREIKSNTVPFKIALDQTFDPVKAGWPLIWRDEFDGKEVDWKNTWMNSPWHPVPRKRDMAYLKDGKLHIKAKFVPDPKKPGKFKGISTELYSQKRFSYGYYEAKLRFTKKPGWWAAFWMLDEGRNAAVGGGYEIDIFEDYPTRSGKNKVANNLHINFGCGNRSYGYHFDLPGSIDDFYVVGCKWTPFEVSLYINGKLVRSTSRHSPYQSATYDAINHGLCTSTLYICLSGQCGGSGGTPQGEGSEEYIVEYVRAYAYPRDAEPQVKLTGTPGKSNVKLGEKLVFEAAARPSAKSGAKITHLYLFDNGNLIDYKEGSKARFEFAIDEKHYGDTIWASSGRSRRKSVFDSYPHFFIVAAQDENGKVGFSSFYPVVTGMGNSSAYKGSVPQVPGKIDTARYDDGGNGNATYKQKRRGGTFPIGEEKLFSRRKLNLREAGEWANFTFNAVKTGTYDIVLNRDQYRRFWPLRSMVLIDGVYVGDFLAKEHDAAAVLENIKLTKGIHRLTLISACAYGVWPLSLEFRCK